MSAPKRKPATYADLERVPPHKVAELIEGALVTHPRPSPRHAAASNSLGVEIGQPFQRGRGGPGGWVFLDEPELHFGADVVVPDLAGWRRERLTSLPETPYLTVAPDWLCEILSPSTARLDRGVKRAIYARAGVSYLWLLDPVEQVLETYALAGEQWLLTGTATGAGDVSFPPFDVISFSLSVLFPFDAPKGSEPTAEG